LIPAVCCPSILQAVQFGGQVRAADQIIVATAREREARERSGARGLRERPRSGRVR
jgi:hypothetical protein